MSATQKPPVQSLAQRWLVLEPQLPPNLRPLVRSGFYAGARTALDVIALPTAPPKAFDIGEALRTLQNLVDGIHRIEAELAVYLQLSKAKG